MRSGIPYRSPRRRLTLIGMSRPGTLTRRLGLAIAVNEATVAESPIGTNSPSSHSLGYCPENTKAPITGAFSKRMKGLEPSTFCMASRRSSQLSYIRETADYSRGSWSPAPACW